MEVKTAPKPIPSYTYDEALSEYRKLGDVNRVYEQLYDKVDKNYLNHVQHAIALGAGYGLNEIAFLNKLTPNLTSFTGVEIDGSCLKQLSKNARSLFPSHVTINLHQETGQNWPGPSEKEGKADLVLMFQCLFFYDKNERKELYEKCFNNWLKPGGIIFVLHHKDLHEAPYSFYMCDILRETGRKVHLESYTIKQELPQLGYAVDKLYTYEYYQDLKAMNDKVVSFIARHADPPYESDDVVKEALKKLIKDGNKGYTSGDLFSIVKKS